MDNATLSGRAAIADLVHRYAFNIRRQRGRENIALFTDDAEFIVRNATPTDLDAAQTRTHVVGREAIADYIARSAGSGILVCPIIHNLLIEIDGACAESSCLMTTRSWPAGHELIGEYHDSFRRDGDSWRFSKRVYTIFQ